MQNCEEIVSEGREGAIYPAKSLFLYGLVRWGQSDPLGTSDK
jgi:hypothetical protein